MKNIVVLSYNSVVRDARILKEADSLSRDGHSVKIYGFFDNSVAQDYPRKRTSGVEIELIKPDLTRGIIGAIYYNHRIIINKSLKWLNHNYKKLAFFVALLSVALFAVFPNIFGSAYFLIFLTFFFVFCVYVVKNKDKVFQALSRLLVSVLSKLRKGLWDKYKSDSLYERIKSEDFDIIHAHDLHTMDAAVKIKKRLKAKLIWDAHEIYEEVAQLSEKDRALARKKISLFQKEVDGFITINDSIAKFYKENYSKLPEPNIIKNATVKYDKKQYDGRLHDAAGLPDSQKIVLYQGGYAEKRGLREIVAASEFFDKDLTLVMMGWGRLESDLKNIATGVNNKTKGNRDYPAVVFVPPVAQVDLPYWTSGAFVGLIPYEHHGLNHLYCTPNKLWEYPNADVPIVCTPMVEMRKVVSEWNIGWVLDDDLVATSIAERINGISDEDHFEKKKNCSVYIDQDNWSVYEKKLIKMYQRVA